MTQRRMYNSNGQTKFKTSMLRSSLGDYSDAYILVSGTMTITEKEANDAKKKLNERNKEVIFKNCTPFTEIIVEYIS